MTYQPNQSEDPSLKPVATGVLPVQSASPYMRLIGYIEAELETIKLQRSAKLLDNSTADMYLEDLLAVRDILHMRRQQEIAAKPTS